MIFSISVVLRDTRLLLHIADISTDKMDRRVTVAVAIAAEQIFSAACSEMGWL